MEQGVHAFVLRYWGLLKMRETPLLCETFAIPCFLIRENYARVFECRSALLRFLMKNQPRVSLIPPRIETVTPKFLDPDLYLEVELRDMERQRTLHIIREQNTFKVCCDIEGASPTQYLA